MSDAIDRIRAALQRGQEVRPSVGGSPQLADLAEPLRQVGAIRNIWTLLAAQSIYVTDHGRW